MSSTVQVANDPTQTWHASHLQYDDGACDGFASSVAETVPGADPGVPMGYWTERDLPFYYGLVRTFPLADHWFSSCLGPTFPNRRFLISGTAHGLIDDLPWDVADYPQAVPAAPAHAQTVLRRRRRGHAAPGQHRGPGLR